MTRRLAVLPILASLLLAGPIAGADERTERAKRRFGEAKAAHQRGDYEEAARLFDEANRLSPRANAVFNAGVAWAQAGKPARAADAYEAALTMTGLSPDKEKVARELARGCSALAQSLGVDDAAGFVRPVLRVAGFVRPV